MGRKKIYMAALLSLVMVLAGCGPEWEYDKIDDVNDLQGRRVGVNLSWEADYYLTGRKDMELVRYDTTADMIMALSCNKIDAFAVDDMLWKATEKVGDGVEKVEPSFGRVGYIMVFGKNDQALTEDFNEYLAEFKKTPEYQKYLERIDGFDGMDYDTVEIPPTGEGKEIHVAVPADGYPHVFFNPEDNVPCGCDVEPLVYFANDRGYKLIFTLTGYDDAIMGLKQGKYDIFTGYIGDVYNDEIRAEGLYVSDNMYEVDMYFVHKNKEKIKVEVDLLE